MLKSQNYFRTRNGQYYTVFTKDILYEIIDNDNPNSFISILHILDYPYIKDEWDRLIKQYGNKAHILGRYCSLMRLKAYQAFGFDDSNELNVIRGNSNFVIIDDRLFVREENGICF